MQDMAALGVRRPTVVTRVSEFIPEVCWSSRSVLLGVRVLGGEIQHRGEGEGGCGQIAGGKTWSGVGHGAGL